MNILSTRGGALVAAAFIGSLGLSACGNATDDATSGSTGSGSASAATAHTITFLPKNLGNPYFDTSDAGGAKAIKEFGGTYSEVGPGTGTPDAQVSYINTLTQQGVGAIVVSANDPTAICDALQEARDNEVKVVT